MVKDKACGCFHPKYSTILMLLMYLTHYSLRRDWFQLPHTGHTMHNQLPSWTSTPNNLGVGGGWGVGGGGVHPLLLMCSSPSHQAAGDALKGKTAASQSSIPVVHAHQSHSHPADGMMVTHYSQFPL